MKFEFPVDRFSNSTQISKFRQIRPVGAAELFHLDVRTYMAKLTVDFRKRLKTNSATTMVMLL